MSCLCTVLPYKEILHCVWALSLCLLPMWWFEGVYSLSKAGKCLWSYLPLLQLYCYGWISPQGFCAPLIKLILFNHHALFLLFPVWRDCWVWDFMLACTASEFVVPSFVQWLFRSVSVSFFVLNFILPVISQKFRFCTLDNLASAKSGNWSMCPMPMLYSSAGRTYPWFVCFKMDIYGPHFVPASFIISFARLIPFLRHSLIFLQVI